MAASLLLTYLSSICPSHKWTTADPEAVGAAARPGADAKRLQYAGFDTKFYRLVLFPKEAYSFFDSLAVCVLRASAATTFLTTLNPLVIAYAISIVPYSRAMPMTILPSPD